MIGRPAVQHQPSRNSKQNDCNHSNLTRRESFGIPSTANDRQLGSTQPQGINTEFALLDKRLVQISFVVFGRMTNLVSVQHLLNFIRYVLLIEAAQPIKAPMRAGANDKAYKVGH